VVDYARLMESLFGFDRMAAWLRSGRRLRFDAMHAVTGPYARRILSTGGASPDSLLREEPLADRRPPSDLTPLTRQNWCMNLAANSPTSRCV
jgi:hypothetical protein